MGWLVARLADMETYVEFFSFDLLSSRQPRPRIRESADTHLLAIGMGTA